MHCSFGGHPSEAHHKYTLTSKIHFPSQKTGLTMVYWHGYCEETELTCIENLGLYSTNFSFYLLYAKSSISHPVSLFALAGRELIASSGAQYRNVLLIFILFLFH